MQRPRLVVNPRRCRPGPHRLTAQPQPGVQPFLLSPSHFKAMLPSELDPPGSSLVHTGLLSSIGGFVSGVTSGWLDSLCLRVDSEVWLCESVCVDGAGSAGCTVWTGICDNMGSGADEGTDSAAAVWHTCSGSDKCVDSWGGEEAVDVCVGRCWVHGSLCLCGPWWANWACVLASCSAEQ